MRTFIKLAIPVFWYLVAVGDFFQNPTLGDFVAVLIHLGSASVAIKDWIERLAAHRRKNGNNANAVVIHVVLQLGGHAEKRRSARREEKMIFIREFPSIYAMGGFSCQ